MIICWCPHHCRFLFPPHMHILRRILNTFSGGCPRVGIQLPTTSSTQSWPDEEEEGAEVLLTTVSCGCSPSQMLGSAAIEVSEAFEVKAPHSTSSLLVWLRPPPPNRLPLLLKLLFSPPPTRMVNHLPFLYKFHSRKSSLVCYEYISTQECPAEYTWTAAGAWRLKTQE